MLSSICPIFPSRDFTVTSAFYEQLGFRVCAIFEKEGYLIIQRDEVELHFFHAPTNDPSQSNHGAYVRVQDANTLSREFEILSLPVEGIPRTRKAEDKPWGVCELAIIDPDGSLLRMGHNLSD